MSCPRTPDQKRKLMTGTEKAAPPVQKEDNTTKVRRSIGEIEARTTTSAPRPTTSQQDGKPKVKTAMIPPDNNTGLSKGRVGTTTTPPEVEKSPKQTTKYKNRTAEAKACLLKAKLNLANSRNLKAEIKAEVMEALERLYNLVKEAEQDRKTREEREEDTGNLHKTITIEEAPAKENQLIKGLEEHGKLLRENKEEMGKLAALLEKQHEQADRKASYASVVASSPKQHHPETAAMHSLIISSKDEDETGEQVFQKLRKVVNAKEEGVRIDRIRKAKYKKVIVGCRDPEEIRKVRARIKEADAELNVEEVKNKDPLIALYGVLQCNTNEEVVKAMRAQNKHLFSGLSEEDDRIEVRFRRKARNPLTTHIVAKVSPQIWQRVTAAGAVHIDIQRVRVADQSPLIQCSRCLGYGHGKRFCQEAVDVCSHCGGAHYKTECADYLAEAPPNCLNCNKAKLGKAEHNAFDDVCPVRRKWDALARSTVAYC